AASDLPALERSQLGVICHFLRDVVLTKVDRGSMRHALEPRSPYLDTDVVRFCAGLPTDRKLRRLTGKYLLRQVAAGWLPPEVTRRRKQGFRAPIGALLRAELAPLLRDTLCPAALARSGLFRPERVRALVAEPLAPGHDHRRKLWALLCSQLWRSEERR